jgi:hypothetical protein
MTSIPIEILGKALAETMKPNYREIAENSGTCAHGFAKDCPTCAHFTKVRASELPNLPTP